MFQFEYLSCHSEYRIPLLLMYAYKSGHLFPKKLRHPTPVPKVLTRNICNVLMGDKVIIAVPCKSSVVRNYLASKF